MKVICDKSKTCVDRNICGAAKPHPPVGCSRCEIDHTAHCIPVSDFNKKPESKSFNQGEMQMRRDQIRSSISRQFDYYDWSNWDRLIDAANEVIVIAKSMQKQEEVEDEQEKNSTV